MNEEKEAGRQKEERLITRGLYLDGLRCPKLIWKDRYAPEEARREETDPVMKQQAEEVRTLGLSLFEGRVPVRETDLNRQCETTAALIAEKTEWIEDASFRQEDCFITADLLHCREDESLELYLIKSALSVRESYLEDLTFQAYVLKELGFRVSGCFVMHLNRSYIRTGDLDLCALFTTVKMMKPVQKRIPKTARKLDVIRSVLESGQCPQEEVGDRCAGMVVCRYHDSCFEAPEENTVFVLNNMGLNQKFELARLGMKDLRVLLEKGKLNRNQTLQARYELEDLPDLIETEKIRGFLASLNYPLYFLDFESFQPAVPRFDHTRPYDQIVFQYSLHILKEKGGVLEHEEFLAEPGADPRRPLAESLCEHVREDGCVLVYNAQFEKTRIKELAELYPDLSGHLLAIAGNIADLAVVFASKWYYSKAMHGKYSLKYVLPALFPEDPELNYDNLSGIHEGRAASGAFPAMETMSEEEREECRKELLAYCALDTLAMVRIVQKLEEVSE